MQAAGRPHPERAAAAGFQGEHGARTQRGRRTERGGMRLHLGLARKPRRPLPAAPEARGHGGSGERRRSQPKLANERGVLGLRQRKVIGSQPSQQRAVPRRRGGGGGSGASSAARSGGSGGSTVQQLCSLASPDLTSFCCSSVSSRRPSAALAAMPAARAAAPDALPSATISAIRPDCAGRGAVGRGAAAHAARPARGATWQPRLRVHRHAHRQPGAASTAARRPWHMGAAPTHLRVGAHRGDQHAAEAGEDLGAAQQRGAGARVLGHVVALARQVALVHPACAGCGWVITLATSSAQVAGPWHVVALACQAALVHPALGGRGRPMGAARSGAPLLPRRSSGARPPCSAWRASSTGVWPPRDGAKLQRGGPAAQPTAYPAASVRPRAPTQPPHQRRT